MHPVLAVLALLLLSAGARANAQQLSADIAHTMMAEHPHGNGAVWNYDEATFLAGMDTLDRLTDDPANVYRTVHRSAYLDYIKTCVDRFVSDDGTIRTYNRDELTLDNILMGRQLLFLYDSTHAPKYKLAADTLYAQLKAQPRTRSGGFWHKQRYPNQMWLDGLYMAEPFRAQYAVQFHHPEDFPDIALQFRLIQAHARDRSTGLYFHAWDEARAQPWADKTTGDSPTLWSRGMGWFGMALVDTLDILPATTPAHAELLAILRQYAPAIAAAADSNGVWQQVADRRDQPGNYEESSASAMFVYTLQKGVRMGWLPGRYHAVAARGYAGIQRVFVQAVDGTVRLTGTADAVGLGGTPYRDGTYAYYTGVKTVTNDARGMGALLLAAVEMERGH